MEENVLQINGGIMINVDVIVKNIINIKKNYIQNPSTCNCENRKYLYSIPCDEIIDAEAKSYDEEIKTVQTNFNEKMQPAQNSIFYLHFYQLL